MHSIVTLVMFRDTVDGLVRRTFYKIKRLNPQIMDGSVKSSNRCARSVQVLSIG